MKFVVRVGAIAFLSALPYAAAAQQTAPSAGPAAPAAVQALVVTAGAKAKDEQLDRTVYSIAKDLQATSGTAADVLNNVPSVSVDVDGNLSLRGDSNVTILVDGKPSAQFSGATKGLSLLQFPANNIDRVEVLTTPPAQYKAEGSGGVINIITKKKKAEGSYGGAQATVGEMGRYVLGLEGSYNAGPLKLSGNLGLRREIRERISSYDRSTLDTTSGAFTPSQQSTDEHFRRLMPSVKTSAEWAFNPRQSLTAAFNHNELSGNRYFDQHNQRGSTDAPSSVSDRHSDGHEWAFDTSKSLRFDQTLGPDGHALSLAVQQGHNGERERYLYTNTSTVPLGGPTFDDLHLGLDLKKSEASADYVLPLGPDRKLKLGYDLEQDHNAYDNTGGTLDPITRAATPDANVTSHFRYRQAVNAGYVQYETPIGAWTLQSGLRYESARASYHLITGDISGSRRDSGFYPSLHLNRPIGDTDAFSAGISRRISRPDPEALNPFTDYQDIHNLRAGNPNLRPQTTWLYEAGYTTKRFGPVLSGNAYVRIDTDSYTSIVRPLSVDVLLSTQTNLPKKKAVGLEFSASGKIITGLNYNVSGDMFRSQIDGAALGLSGLRSTSGINLKGSLDARFSSADTAQLSFTRQDKRLTPQGYQAALNLVNLGYKHQFGPGLAVTVTLSDALDGQRQRRVTRTPTLVDNNVRHQVGRVALVGLTYSFGAPKKSKGAGFQYDQ